MSNSPYDIESSPGYTLARAVRSMKNALGRAFREGGFDATPEQWGVLCRLAANDGLSQKDLAEAICTDAANVARIVAALERRGLVTRKRSDRDRRMYGIHITPEGRRLHLEMTDLVVGFSDQVFSCFTHDECERLMRLAATLANHLDQGCPTSPKARVRPTEFN